MNDVLIKILRVGVCENLDIPLPKYMTPFSSGMDICAANECEINLLPGNIELVPTGFAVEIPKGYEAQIRPRSGLAINKGIGILNSPGTIDSDYRGEIKIIVINFGKTNFVIKRGSRIAQMVISKVFYATFDIVDELEQTQRFNGGFGHTDIF